MTAKAMFCVNVDSPIAVYVQIENQVQFGIAAGRIKPGDTLPSVREMSVILGINPNTVTKAYRDLELLQLVQSRRGVGVTVTEKASAICREATVAMVRGHLNDAVAECVASGLSGGQVRKWLSEALESGAMPYSGRKKR